MTLTLRERQDLIETMNKLGYQISTDTEHIIFKYILNENPPSISSELLFKLEQNKSDLIQYLILLRTPLDQIQNPIYIKSGPDLNHQLICLVPNQKQKEELEKNSNIPIYTPDEIRWLLKYIEGVEDKDQYLRNINSVKTIFPGSRIITVSHLSGPGQEKEETDMKMSELYPSKYFSKEDLPKPKVFTIDSCERDEIKGENGSELKPVLYFTEKDSKPLILNKTNAEVIAELYGDDSDDWIGKEIELYVDKNVKFGAKKTGGIRVRATRSSGQDEN